jgi:hypothetical protein
MAKSFEHWEREEVELTFGVEQMDTLAALSAWMSAENTISESDKKLALRLQTKLIKFYDLWNEDEIKSFFNIPLIEIIDFTAEDFVTYKTFTQRNLIGTLKDVNGNDVDLNGRVELLVSKGKQKPRQPYFFFNEYKPALKGKNDPLGQLLIAMLVGEAQNQHKFPVYGVYVIGEDWRFVVLDGKQYAISKTFSAIEDDIFQIMRILLFLKGRIEALAVEG